MSTVHAFLSNIPEDIDYEKLLKQAWDTFQEYPPTVIAKAGQLNISCRYYNIMMISYEGAYNISCKHFQYHSYSVVHTDIIK